MTDDGDSEMDSIMEPEVDYDSGECTYLYQVREKRQGNDVAVICRLVCFANCCVYG